MGSPLLVYYTSANEESRPTYHMHYTQGTTAEAIRIGGCHTASGGTAVAFANLQRAPLAGLLRPGNYPAASISLVISTSLSKFNAPLHLRKISPSALMNKVVGIEKTPNSLITEPSVVKPVG